jgi:hypothetical protein
MENAGTKGRFLLGIASISLTSLNFAQTHREESEKAQSRLLNVFRLEGCRRYEEENFIDATVDTAILSEALHLVNLSQESFSSMTSKFLSNPRDIPRLNLAQPVTCLNGLQRIRAAREWLDANDQWWIVRLYSSRGNAAQDLGRPSLLRRLQNSITAFPCG